MTNTLSDQSSTGYLLHPRTGALLEPLFRWHGGAVWPIFGGADGDDDDVDDPDEEQDDDEAPEPKKGKAGKEDPEKVTKADLDAVTKRMKAADKRATAAEAKLKQAEDAKKDELTKATERVAELEKSQEAKDKDLADLRLQNAFLTAKTGVIWHDPADALALAERQGYLADVVDEDGKVDSEALGEALKKLAEAKPHLVKEADASDNEGKGKSSKNGQGAQRTGGSVGSKGKSGKGEEPDLSRYNKLLMR